MLTVILVWNTDGAQALHRPGTTPLLPPVTLHALWARLPFTSVHLQY